MTAQELKAKRDAKASTKPAATTVAPVTTSVPSYVQVVESMNFATVSGVPLWVVDESYAIMNMECVVTASRNNNLYLAPPVAIQHKVKMIHTGSYFDAITTEQLFGVGAVLNSRIQAYKPSPIDEAIVNENYADNAKAISNWKKAIAEKQTRLYLVDFTEV